MKGNILGRIFVIAVIVASLGAFFYHLWYHGVFAPRISAQVYAGFFSLGGKAYVSADGKGYTEGRTIAKGGDCHIVSIKEDSTHTFVVVRSFLDQALYVLQDYKIPQDGDITKANWGGKEIIDADFFKAVSSILSLRHATDSFETEGIFMLTDTQELKELYLAYENCPIATEYKGYMGTVNGTWVITVSQNTTGIIDCYVIPAEYTEILEKYLY